MGERAAEPREPDGAGRAVAARQRAFPRIVAHRGASRAAPENTLAAILATAAGGAGAVELDVSLLGDGTPVLHHDATLDRCTDAAGPLTASGRAALPGIDAGRRFAPAFAGEPLPTLAAALDLAGALGLAVNLEMKPHDGDAAALADAVAGALAARGWTAGRVLVSSFSAEALAAFAARLPGRPLAVLWRAVPEGWAGACARLGAGAVHAEWRGLDPARAREIRAAGRALRVFTANDPAALLPLRGLIDGVITDDPRLYLDDPGWAAWAGALT